MPNREDAEPIEIPNDFIDSLPDNLTPVRLEEDEIDLFAVELDTSDRFAMIREQYLQRFGETFDIYRATQSGNPLELAEVAEKMQSAIESGVALSDNDFGLGEFDITADY